MKRISPIVSAALALLLVLPAAAQAQSNAWEVTPESKAALERGIEWLARNQGAKGNWDNENLGLVSMGLLAYLSAGHLPGRGKYGHNSQMAMDYILNNAKPSGLLNIAVRGHDMYNHGLATFVLGQLYGMTGDKRVGRVLDRALRLIQDSQCSDGGWDYVAISKPEGHDLSLTVMQAKALRSAMDCGFKVDSRSIERALAYVRRHYVPEGGHRREEPLEQIKRRAGMFTYQPNGNLARAGITMTSIGVVCLQEFGQYDDWRIGTSMQYIRKTVQAGEKVFNDQYRLSKKTRSYAIEPNHVPFDAYTLYYLSQAIYQRGGDDWKICYTILRNELVKRQKVEPNNPQQNGAWLTSLWGMRDKEAQLYGTAIGCFTLAIPNRYLPILQEGRIESLIKPVGEKE
ncbi:MAG: squalene--hopene cyclase [Planctomycetaceae bacterium]|nr:squalene--hopene cyclase [Planctomycetaceae bacterium]